jgi:hypothetical protein
VVCKAPRRGRVKRNDQVAIAERFCCVHSVTSDSISLCQPGSKTSLAVRFAIRGYLDPPRVPAAAGITEAQATLPWGCTGALESWGSGSDCGGWGGGSGGLWVMGVWSGQEWERREPLSRAPQTPR